MKKISFFILTLGNIVIFASEKKQKIQSSKSVTATTTSSVLATNNSSSTTTSSSTTSLNTNPNASLQEEALGQGLQSSINFSLEHDFDATTDDESAAKTVAYQEGPFNKFWRFYYRTQKFRENMQEMLGLISAHEKLHKLAIEDKLDDHLKTLDQQNFGAAARFIDTAINTAITDQNELMLKQVLLDIEKISTSSLTHDTKTRISDFVKKCSHERKKAIIDILAAYLQECDQDACFIRKFTDPQPETQERHSLSCIILEAQRQIEELTKRFSANTLSVEKK